MARDINKTLLLFSGGMDSFILKDLYSFPNSSCLFVRMGTKENAMEEQFIDKHFPGVIKANLPIAIYELDNHIIPYRNHMLALLAANYANNIYFAFTVGDTTRDKDFVFKAQMEGLLNYFSADHSKVKIPGPFTIQIPFKEYTKTELVERYGVRLPVRVKKLLTKTFSCYQGTEMPCGTCRSCIRNYVALKNNGIETGQYFVTNPFPYLAAFYEASKRKGRSINELKEIEICMNQK